MEYVTWRNDIFGKRPGSNPVTVERLPETGAISPAENFDHVDRALDDAEIHEIFSPEQIGIGLQLIYSNCCSNICLCYIEAGDEKQRRVAGIHNLCKLYENYFNRYCLAPVRGIGDGTDGGVGFLCYMFWDCTF